MGIADSKLIKPGIYNAIVKDNTDKLGMGRVRVYIPSFGGNPGDENTWYTANPVSPQAGQTNPYENTKGGKEDYQSQDSYGMWANGYHIGNEILITFLNGDPSKAVILGGMFGQNMTNSVAGYPAAKSHQGTTRGVHPPTVEYNKRDDEINPRNPIRPRRALASQQLKKQGLYRDTQRGQMSTSPHRDEVPQFTSMKTPRGNILVMDDGKLDPNAGSGRNERDYTRASSSHAFIRAKTSRGAQLYLNDNCGYVYMNSADGNAFLQIADNSISLYSAANISTRAKSSFSLRVDGTYNLEVLGSTTMKAVGSFTNNVEGTTNIYDKGSGIKIDTTSDYNVKTKNNLSIEAKGDHSEKAGSNIIEYASIIFENTFTPSSVPEAQEIIPTSASDRAADGCNGQQESESSLPSSGLVTHEPSGSHSGACGQDGGAPGLNCGPISEQELSDGSSGVADSNPDNECGSPVEGDQDHPGQESAPENKDGYIKVVDSGPGWTDVMLPDGTIEHRVGARNWRNNNPGNISAGNFANSQGAIGSDGRFAVFPTYEAGRAAQENLLFESDRTLRTPYINGKYKDQTIAGAITGWAPPTENNTSAYIHAVTSSLGVSADTPMSSLSPSQRSSFLDAMERVEGFKAGRVSTR